MKVIPRTEEEFISRELFPGEYKFTIVDAKESISEAGNEMIKVHLKIIDINGNDHNIIDYLVDKKPFDYKIRHLSECCEVLDKYKKGEFNSYDLLNKKGIVKLVNKKDKNGNQRLSVNDYIVDKNLYDNNSFDDKIPF